MLTAELCERIQAALPAVLAGRDHLRLKEDNSYVSEGDLLIQSVVSAWVQERLPDYHLKKWHHLGMTGTRWENTWCWIPSMARRILFPA